MNHFPKELEKFAFILKNIAHPTRIAILEQLHYFGEMSVGVISNRLRIDLHLVSHHLSNMKMIGIVERKREGNELIYFLSKDNKLVDIVRIIDSINLNI